MSSRAEKPKMWCAWDRWTVTGATNMTLPYTFSHILFRMIPTPTKKSAIDLKYKKLIKMEN